MCHFLTPARWCRIKRTKGKARNLFLFLQTQEVVVTRHILSPAPRNLLLPKSSVALYITQCYHYTSPFRKQSKKKTTQVTITKSTTTYCVNIHLSPTLENIPFQQTRQCRYKPISPVTNHDNLYTVIFSLTVNVNRPYLQY